MTGPLGNSEFCFPRISIFPSTSSRETLRFSGNKIYCSPRDQSLSVYCSAHLFTIITLQSFRERREMRDCVEFKEDLEKGFGHAFSSFSVRTAMRLIP